MQDTKNTKKRVAILGSTGSIGTQTLEVISEQNHLFEVEVLTAHNNADLLIQQALQFKPNAVVIGNENLYPQVHEALWGKDIKVYAGAKALEEIVQSTQVDIVLTALVGYAGLLPTIAAIKAGKDIALANKETLVVAGALIKNLTLQHKVKILPVDSEHSAIFQCLVGEFNNPIEKIYLTASGGPFRGKTAADLVNVTKQQALKHPNWEMGAKITIDSASLMNKGLEVIEAQWLFDLQPNQIDVIVHPQSIIHSLVQFEDGSMKAQMGLPDMKLPIQYALAYPDRVKNSLTRFNFMDYPNLTFESPDKKTFRNLALAYQAMEKGGNVPCVLNAANEIAVAAFLKEQIGFTNIPQVVEHTLQKLENSVAENIECILDKDEIARHVAQQYISSIGG